MAARKRDLPHRGSAGAGQADLISGHRSQQQELAPPLWKTVWRRPAMLQVKFTSCDPGLTLPGRSPTIPVCPGSGRFLGYAAFSAATRKTPSKPGGSGRPASRRVPDRSAGECLPEDTHDSNSDEISDSAHTKPGKCPSTAEKTIGPRRNTIQHRKGTD